MRNVRFSIGALMVAVLIAAIGLALLRYGSRVWAGVLFLLTCAALCLAVVAVVCRRGAERAWWLGFALFGWGYMALAFWFSEQLHELPTITLLTALGSRLGIPNFGSSAASGRGGLDPSYARAGHCVWALVAALLGGIASWALWGVPTGHSERSAVADPRRGEEAPGWWRQPAIVGLMGFATVALEALAGSRLAPGLWAGATFLLTCGLLGYAALGAIGGRGKIRQIWLGATLFGAGYMMLTFGRDRTSWPSIPTDHFLYAIRPGFPPIVSGFPVSSEPSDSTVEGTVGLVTKERILHELERRVPLRFPQETPLKRVLMYIKDATRGPYDQGIPIYVDPIGLQEAQETLESPVSIDVKDVPLKLSLSMCLNRLGLAYRVRDGYLMISTPEEVMPAYDDPFLIVGHCLLALVAAGLGGVLAPLASAQRGDPSERAAV